jgi:hypothetical protein
MKSGSIYESPAAPLTTDARTEMVDAGHAVAESAAVTAWQRFRDTLQSQRDELLRHEYSRHPLLRAQGLYFLQTLETSAFNMYIAPRQQYPALYVQSMFMPFELTWGMQNPDFLNHNGFIDGAHTYRIHGNGKGSYWATLQVFRGFWGDELQGTLAHVDFDDVASGPNGEFEIFLGPNPPADTQRETWIRLDPEAHNIMLAVRETFYDWQRDVPMDFHIETLDRDPAAPMYFDETELAARIDRAHKFANYSWKFASGQFKPADAANVRNEFTVDPYASTHGGNPLASYVQMLYDIGPDDALIIEMSVLEARYWGFQIGSVWGQTTDYSYHQSSISGAQAHIDADGRFRAVVSLQDPAVPNWLDPVGIPIGVVLLRWYKSTGVLVPTVTPVKVADVRNHLPVSTPEVTTEQRRRELEVRRVTSLRRYGQ